MSLAGGWTTLRRHRTVGDAMLATLLAVLAVGGTVGAASFQPEARPLDTLGVALILAGSLPLAGRRSWPLPVLAASTVTLSAYLLIGYPFGPVLFPFSLAVYTVAVWLPARVATLATLTVLPVFLLGHLVSGDLGAVVPGSAWVILPFAIGWVVRARRETVARNRAEQVRQHAYEARLYVAQEVHDIVGHGLAAINMQAEIALHLLQRHPEQAGTALAAISRTSKEALDELRATLAVVRRGGSRPGVAGLPDLAERLSTAGVPVTLRVDGQRRDLPEAVDLAAYRVAQEALTNVVRHAGPATAQVRLDYQDDALAVDVTDTGQGGGAPTAVDGGHGLPGMRDRVTALGGEFAAGPRPDGGFAVHARFPLAAHPVAGDLTAGDLTAGDLTAGEPATEGAR